MEQKIKQILYVDDDEDMLALIKVVLESTVDVEVHTYHSASQALNDLSKIAPQMIILDFQMPEMNGVELLHAIRERKVQTPVTFFTAQSMPEEIQRLLELGAERVIVKPVDIEKLPEALGLN